MVWNRANVKTNNPDGKLKTWLSTFEEETLHFCPLTHQPYSHMHDSLISQINLSLLKAKIHKLQHEGLIGPMFCFSENMWTIKEMSCAHGWVCSWYSSEFWRRNPRKFGTLDTTFVSYQCFLYCGPWTSLRLRTHPGLQNTKSVFSKQNRPIKKQDIGIKTEKQSNIQQIWKLRVTLFDSSNFIVSVVLFIPKQCGIDGSVFPSMTFISQSLPR